MIISRRARRGNAECDVRCRYEVHRYGGDGFLKSHVLCSRHGSRMYGTEAECEKWLLKKIAKEARNGEK